jgi:hypothetical protein
MAKTLTNNPMTQEQINAIAQDALAWAQGSWGQGRYDQPRYDKETMLRIYSALADLCRERAIRNAQ